MKLVNTLLATLLLSMGHAQESETVLYTVDTQQKIQSLRLSVINCDEKVTTASSPIGAISDSTVSLHLNPFTDYELMVNNTTRIEILSNDIQKSLMPKEEEESLPIPIFASKSWIISQE